jgi:hypothetical protein
MIIFHPHNRSGCFAVLLFLSWVQLHNITEHNVEVTKRMHPVTLSFCPLINSVNVKNMPSCGTCTSLTFTFFSVTLCSCIPLAVAILPLQSFYSRDVSGCFVPSCAITVYLSWLSCHGFASTTLLAVPAIILPK